MVDVVLLKDHETLGSKGKIAKVKRTFASFCLLAINILFYFVAGFARNFLYPQGIVVYATNENIVKYAATKTTPSLNPQ